MENDDNPYQAPEDRSKPTLASTSSRKFTSGQVVIIFLTPALMVLIGGGLGLYANSGGLVSLSLWGGIFAIVAVSAILANHYAGGGNGDRTGALIGYFLLVLISEVFLAGVTVFGGCLLLFTVFSNGWH